MRTKLKVIIATGAIGFSFGALAAADPDVPQEKCYCIAKAGQNDCAGVSHGCVAQATKDFDCNDWKYVASGSCTEIGGSTIPSKQPQKQ